jgi:GT2 family glycosyltransferase
MDVPRYTGLFETCNVLYPREMLERLAGFDESFRHACGEDVDLGLRALDSGADSTFEPAAVVRHSVEQPSLRQVLRSTWKWTDAVRVTAMHPQLRSLLVWGAFWKPTHPRLLLAGTALGLAAGTRRPAFAALAAPYLALYLRTYDGRVGAALRALPPHAVIDTFEVVTAAAGSVRYRTLML